MSQIILGKWGGYDITYDEFNYYLETSLFDDITGCHISKDTIDDYFYNYYITILENFNNETLIPNNKYILNEYDVYYKHNKIKVNSSKMALRILSLIANKKAIEDNYIKKEKELNEKIKLLEDNYENEKKEINNRFKVIEDYIYYIKIIIIIIIIFV